jgi:hypothetical protein
MRLDRVEIKVNLSGDQTTSAVERLELPPVEQPWRIYFCEDVARGVSAATPLQEAGVILRARHRPDRKDDSTIKLRPGRRSQLTDDWLEAEEGEDWELKVEAAWSAGRRVLAISRTADRPDDVVVDAGHGRGPEPGNRPAAAPRTTGSTPVHRSWSTWTPPWSPRRVRRPGGQQQEADQQEHHPRVRGKRYTR